MQITTQAVNLAVGLVFKFLFQKSQTQVAFSVKKRADLGPQQLDNFHVNLGCLIKHANAYIHEFIQPLEAINKAASIWTGLPQDWKIRGTKTEKGKHKEFKLWALWHHYDGWTQRSCSFQLGNSWPNFIRKQTHTVTISLCVFFGAGLEY